MDRLPENKQEYVLTMIRKLKEGESFLRELDLTFNTLHSYGDDLACVLSNECHNEWSKFCYLWISMMATCKRYGCYDSRNELSVRLCSALVNILDRDKLAYVAIVLYGDCLNDYERRSHFSYGLVSKKLVDKYGEAVCFTVRDACGDGLHRAIQAYITDFVVFYLRNYSEDKEKLEKLPVSFWSTARVN